MVAIQRDFRSYRLNVYLLNSMALKIQHWFFNKVAQCNQKQAMKEGNQMEKTPMSKFHDRRRTTARMQLGTSQAKRNFSSCSSSAMSFQAPGAPVKKSQQRTLLVSQRAASLAQATGLVAGSNTCKALRQGRRRRGTPSSAGASQTNDFNNCFSNELVSFNDEQEGGDAECESSPCSAMQRFQNCSLVGLEISRRQRSNSLTSVCECPQALLISGRESSNLLQRHGMQTVVSHGNYVVADRSSHLEPPPCNSLTITRQFNKLVTVKGAPGLKLDTRL